MTTWYFVHKALGDMVEKQVIKEGPVTVLISNNFGGQERQHKESSYGRYFEDRLEAAEYSKWLAIKKIERLQFQMDAAYKVLSDAEKIIEAEV